MNERSKEDTLTLRELRKISKILILANASVIEKELSEIAKTDSRKKMWVLIDGKRMPQDVADVIGVTRRAVTYFLDDAAVAEFIEYNPYAPPRKILDYVPPSWIELVAKERGEEEALKDKKLSEVEAADAKDKTSEKDPDPQTMKVDSTITSKQE